MLTRDSDQLAATVRPLTLKTRLMSDPSVLLLGEADRLAYGSHDMVSIVGVI